MQYCLLLLPRSGHHDWHKLCASRNTRLLGHFPNPWKIKIGKECKQRMHWKYFEANVAIICRSSTTKCENNYFLIWRVYVISENVCLFICSLLSDQLDVDSYDNLSHLGRIKNRHSRIAGRQLRKILCKKSAQKHSC